MSQKTISDFYMDQYRQFAAYDVYRKIPIYCDGLKVSARKVIYTALKHKVRKPEKLDTLCATALKETKYLHGVGSLEGVTVGLAQDFSGANNLPILKRKGVFGNRVEPTASASRYISACLSSITEKLFRAEDIPVLITQTVDNKTIEPRFYVPTIPIALINGSEGMAVGFAHKILSRDPKKIIHYLKCKLQDKGCRYDFVPYYKGFNGTVKRVENNTYTITGCMEQLNLTKIRITEIPVNISLDKYIKHLNKLEDKGIIRSYKDMSNKNSFEFIINVSREFTKIHTTEEIMRLFKLIKTETENLTFQNEDLVVQTFNTPQEMIESYMNVKLIYMQKRKDYMIKTLQELIDVLVSKTTFIKAVIDEKLILTKRATSKIEKDLDKLDKVFRIDDNYNYLLNMPISSITKEKYDKLLKQLKEEKDKLAKLKKTTIEQMWIQDLDELEKCL